jgi:hypothetical protein
VIESQPLKKWALMVLSLVMVQPEISKQGTPSHYSSQLVLFPFHLVLIHRHLSH